MNSSFSPYTFFFTLILYLKLGIKFIQKYYLAVYMLYLFIIAISNIFDIIFVFINSDSGSTDLNTSTQGGSLNSGPSGSNKGNYNPGEMDLDNMKKDTDYLHDYLSEFKNKRIGDTDINMRKRNFDPNATLKEQYTMEISRIYANVRVNNKDWLFTYRDYESPGNKVITEDFLKDILHLKENYLGWPSRR